MKKKISANDVIGVLIMVVFGTALILYSISVFAKYRNYILYNECINLNEYIENMSDDDSLPVGEVVSLNVNKCYGMFYKKTSRGKHKTTSYYYAVGLNDGSVMVIIATTYRKDMDRMAEYTLSGEDPNSLTLYGTLNSQRKGVSTRFTDEVNYLKGEGIIPQDAKVRYVSMSDGDGKAAAIMLIVFFLLIGICLYIAAWKFYQNHSVNVPRDCTEIREIKSNPVKYVIIYVISVILMYALFCIMDYGDGEDVRLILNLTLSLFLGLIVPCAFANIDDRYDSVKVNKPVSRNDEFKPESEKKHDHFTNNIRLFGYTQLMLAEAERIIAEYAPGNDKDRKMDLCFYKDFILYPADYCCLKGDYKKAMKYLSNTSAKQLNEDHDLIYKYGGVPTYAYLADKMEAVRGLGDKDLAEKVMEEAKPYFEKDNLNSKMKFMINIFMYHYDMLMGDMDGAKACVEQLMTHTPTEKECITPYVLYAEWLIESGDRDSAEVQMNEAREKAFNSIKTVRQTYDGYIKRFDMDEMLMIIKKKTD